MKIFLFKSLIRVRSASAYHVVMGIIFAFLLVSCKRVAVSKKEVSGTYMLIQFGVIDKVVLDENGTFKQIITFTNGEAWSCHGTWNLYSDTVEVQPFYRTFDFGSNGVIRIIPPNQMSMDMLTFAEGRFLHDDMGILPIWIKQTTTNSVVAH